MNSEARYLLIIACSQRKRSDPGLLPAITRYDGGSFRVLRKAKREGCWAENLNVLILSAKYGLIETSTLIANYEQRISCERAKEIQNQVLQSLKTYSKQNSYTQVYIDLSRDYQIAIEGIAELFSTSQLIYAKGRIGERLKYLKNWIAMNSDR